MNDNTALFSHCTDRSNTKIVFLCVKPIVIKERKTNLFLNCNDLVSTYGPIIVISVLAGTTIQAIRNAFGFDANSALSHKIKFARIMPNTACSLNSGICGISTDVNDPQFHHFLTSFLSLLGLCEVVSESQLNAVCGLGGSGIAFVCLSDALLYCILWDFNLV